jgi:hypothetical protein
MPFIAFLNNLIEEGVGKMTTYTTMWEREARCGLVTSVTDDALQDGRHEWAKMGFLSRMLVFSYSCPISVVHRVFESLVDDYSGYEEKTKLSLPNRLVDVDIPKDIAKEAVPISMSIGASMKLYGFRFFLNTKTMLKSLALMKGEKTVSRTEWEEFMELTQHFNLECSPLSVHNSKIMYT